MTQGDRISQDGPEWVDRDLLRRSAILSAVFNVLAVVLHYTGYYDLFQLQGVLQILELAWGWITLVAFLYLAVKATSVAAYQVMTRV